MQPNPSTVSILAQVVPAQSKVPPCHSHTSSPFFHLLASMATVLDVKAAWTEDDIETYMKLIDPDVLYCFEDSEVPRELQAKLGFSGFKSMAKLRGLGDSRDDIKNILKTALGIDNDVDLLARSTVASVQAAWESAKIFADKKIAIGIASANLYEMASGNCVMAKNTKNVFTSLAPECYIYIYIYIF